MKQLYRTLFISNSRCIENLYESNFQLGPLLFELSYCPSDNGIYKLPRLLDKLSLTIKTPNPKRENNRLLHRQYIYILRTTIT